MKTKQLFLILCFAAITSSTLAFADETSEEQPAPQVYHLTKNDHKLLDVGEIGQAQYVIGGLLGTFWGFGIGQAVQNRWTYDGWKFTVGELGGLTAFGIGFGMCVGTIVENVADGIANPYSPTIKNRDCSTASGVLMIGGALAFLGFRVWEIVDAWVTPQSYNRDLSELKNRMNGKAVSSSSLYFGPIAPGAIGLGFARRF